MVCALELLPLLCIDLSKRMCYVVLSNLPYACRNVHLITFGNIETQSACHVQTARQLFEINIQSIGDPQSDPFLNITNSTTKKGAIGHQHGRIFSP